MEPMEKLKNYDKFCGHELNIFLYFKDKDFFNDVVSDFIVNKKEKELTDYYLLGDKESLK